VTVARLRPPQPGAAVLLATITLVSLPDPRANGAAASSIAQLAPTYELILNTRFDQVDQALRACAPAPAEACRVLAASALWWRILLNPNDTTYDQSFRTTADAAIAATEQWTAREPQRADAWFFLGAAYGARVSFRVQRGERLSAARDGKRIKESLERALELDPHMDDARFGIGLYKYYADIAPAAAKFLRFLLLLPGGDRVQGLKDMETVHERGTLLRGEADYQLHWIYLWYENQPKRALELLNGLRERYPANPHLAMRAGEIEEQYFHDAGASLGVWQALADGAARTGDPVLSEAAGRMGAAVQLNALDETDRGLAELDRVLAMAPARPFGAQARAQLLRGTLLDRLGQRQAAAAAFTAALTAVPSGDPDGIAAKARAGLRATPDLAAGEAYRASLVGWRAYERGALDEAEAALGQAASRAPRDQVIQVRHARVQQARQDAVSALKTYDAIIAARPHVSPLALAAAYAWSAEVLEARGDLQAARARYRSATHVFAADSRLQRECRRALDRIGTK
jgi:predicted negative regulator of RcsB-dependent stress response